MSSGFLLKVLIVDDEPILRKGIAELIDWEAEGFVIAGEAADGNKAVLLLKESSYDLIISDIKMPGMDGMEFIAFVRENGLSGARFLFLSGYYDFQYARTAIQYGCCDYILKPVQKEELLSCIRRIREEYLRNADNRKMIQTYEKAFLERHLLALVWGKYDDEDLRYVSDKLRFSEHNRYVHCEMALFDKGFSVLSGERRRGWQRRLYHCACALLEQYKDYVIYNLMKHTECYNIGIIYCSFMSEEKGLTETEWLEWLRDELSERTGYRVIAYMGGETADIRLIGNSYREAILIRALQHYSMEAARISKQGETIVRKRSDKIFRARSDELLCAIEVNDVFQIREKAGDFYKDVVDCEMAPEAISRNVQYLMHGLLKLAYDQDAEIDQEEIMQYMRETVFSSEVNWEKKQKFQQFSLVYADFLTQLRKNVGKGVLKQIEEEVETAYAQNLTLKSMGEKYFVNSVYLGQLFKKQYNCSFKEYLNHIRLQKAAEKLLNSDKKVSQIAEEVGYKSIDYFINKFVENYNMTPLRFRKQKNGG